MALAFALGIAGSVVLFLTNRIEAYAALLPAGALAAWLIADRRRGLGGLLAGVALAFGAAGANDVMARMDYCAGEGCSGISSPAFTAWLAIGLLGMGIAVAAAGYGIGRAARRLTARLRRPAVASET